MPYEHILYAVENGRARITLNRPERRNALCPPLLEELERALWDADDDKRVHCVIAARAARAQPERSRQAPTTFRGAACARSTTTSGRWSGATAASARSGRCNKPSIAQVHGHCLAGGTDLALACDMVIAADDASIGFPPARNLGALPNNPWIYHCGPQWAKRLQLTGDTVSGADAAKIGLALKSVPPELLEAEVEGLADRLALIDPDLLAANKRIVNLAMELMGAQVLQRLAAENDARGHLAPATKDYFRAVKEKGLAGAFRERDAKFGDGRARVEGPELRDERGFLK
jgi:enoyl-CoA hydratase